MQIKDIVKDQMAHFVFYRDKALFYETDKGFQFPVPIDDAGSATLKNQEKILSWMYQITRNVMVDYYRKQRSTEDIDNVVVAEEMDIGEDVKKELAQCLLPMVDQLPANYQDALKMAEFDGLTQKEDEKNRGKNCCPPGRPAKEYRCEDDGKGKDGRAGQKGQAHR